MSTTASEPFKILLSHAMAAADQVTVDACVATWRLDSGVISCFIDGERHALRFGDTEVDVDENGHANVLEYQGDPRITFDIYFKMVRPMTLADVIAHRLTI